RAAACGAWCASIATIWHGCRPAASRRRSTSPAPPPSRFTSSLANPTRPVDRCPRGPPLLAVTIVSPDRRRFRMQLILYYAPNACSLVPYVTLTEAGAPFEVRPLNFRKSQHMTPEYLRLNPKHKVPVLVIDGVPLTENVAIQTWIARNFPAAGLLPSDPMQELHAIS